MFSAAELSGFFSLSTADATVSTRGVADSRWLPSWFFITMSRRHLQGWRAIDLVLFYPLPRRDYYKRRAKASIGATPECDTGRSAYPRRDSLTAPAGFRVPLICIP